MRSRDQGYRLERRRRGIRRNIRRRRQYAETWAPDVELIHTPRGERLRYVDGTVFWGPHGDVPLPIVLKLLYPVSVIDFWPPPQSPMLALLDRSAIFPLAPAVPPIHAP